MHNEKIALVTGATRGIGLETVRQLASRGVHTLLAGRDRARAVDAALALQAQGLPVEAIALDVTDEAGIADATRGVEQRHGRLDILVNNAGIFRDDSDKTPSGQTLEAWRETFDTNLFGVIATTQAFLPLLRKSAAGRIVNLSSELASLALHGDPGSRFYDFKVPAYNVSKTAVNAWTVHLAHELRDTPIKVNAVDPGSVKTDMNEDGELDIATGARGSVLMALIDDAGPTGSYPPGRGAAMVSTRLLLPSLLATALAACTVGPDFVRPEVAVPERFVEAPQADADAAGTGAVANPAASDDATAPSAADPAFWRSFDDPQLTALVEQALSANHDLRIALAHYDSANALLRGAKFDRFPTVTASGQASDARASADQAPGVARQDRDGKSYSAGVDASWELDLFGRIRRNVEARRAEANASAADLEAAQVAIVGELARTYFDLRGAQERLRVANENADNQRETLRLVDARLQAGRGTEFDTARARAQLEATSARVPALEAQVAFDMHRLAVLVGRTPDALVDELQPLRPLPALPARLDAGTPGDLLRRRPDIAAAEARLHAATARIGVATADLFPRFTLGGLIGSQAIDSSALFERDSETRLVALGIDWSFLDIGRVRARIAASDADAAGELARYQQTVLLALEDTENALVRYARARSEDEHLGRAAADSATAARLARVRFDAGAIDLLEVLDAERTQLQAQDAFADSRTRSATGAVSLYVALAGGWPQTLPLREKLASAAD